MATYQYKAKRGPGEAIAGLLEAESRADALDKLSRQGYFPLRIDEFQDIRQVSRHFWNAIPQKELNFFTRQVADLLESNISLVRALQLTEEQTTHAAMRSIIKAVVDQVSGGKSFSAALEQFPVIFPALYVNLVRAGEVGGMLSVTLSRLADFMEQEDEIRSRVLAALVYPLLITGVGGLTVLFLMIFVVPRLTAMFIDSGQGMPWIARVLASTSDWITSGKGEVLFVLLISGAAWLFIQNPDKAKAFLNRILLKLPVWGTVLKKGILARFARTLAMLLTGGVPIIEALKVVSHVLDQPEFQEPIKTVAREVEQGASLSVSIRQAGLFPPFICQMIAIGEEANTLEKSLEKVAITYERETNRAVKLATSLLEPVMILGVGSVIGVIVVGMLLPIFQISAFVK